MGSPPARYVALLRGVNNAGMGARVAMGDLRVAFEGAGFRDVRTLLNSGNVIFSAATRRRAEVLARIEEVLASRLQLASRVTILSADEVAAAVRDNPLARVASNPSHLLVVVPLIPSGVRKLQALANQPWTPEVFALGRRVAYLWCARGVARSPLWAAADRALEGAGTARNIATMTKLSQALKMPTGLSSSAELA